MRACVMTNTHMQPEWTWKHKQVFHEISLYLSNKEPSVLWMNWWWQHTHVHTHTHTRTHTYRVERHTEKCLFLSLPTFSVVALRVNVRSGYFLFLCILKQANPLKTRAAVQQQREDGLLMKYTAHTHQDRTDEVGWFALLQFVIWFVECC